MNDAKNFIYVICEKIWIATIATTAVFSDFINIKKSNILTTIVTINESNSQSITTVNSANKRDFLRFSKKEINL
jgi:hypothetical protein